MRNTIYNMLMKLDLQRLRYLLMFCPLVVCIGSQYISGENGNHSVVWLLLGSAVVAIALTVANILGVQKEADFRFSSGAMVITLVLVTGFIGIDTPLAIIAAIVAIAAGFWQLWGNSRERLSGVVMLLVIGHCLKSLWLVPFLPPLPVELQIANPLNAWLIFAVIGVLILGKIALSTGVIPFIGVLLLIGGGLDLVVLSQHAWPLYGLGFLQLLVAVLLFSQKD